MIRSLKIFRLISIALAACLLMGMMVGGASAQRRRNPQAGKKKAAKRIGIGTAMTVLGAIGMRECDAFSRHGERMLVYESLA